MPDIVLLPAGLLVGIVNAVAGGGSLLSFPLFLLLGYSPLVANVSNSVGVFPSNFGGIWGYREDLRSSKRLALHLSSSVGAGTVVGAVVLLRTGEAVFEAVVPWVILAGCLLMLLQPMVVERLKRNEHEPHLAWATTAAFFVGIYGGYFGPGVGVMLLAVFGAFVPASLQRINGFKNMAAFANNLICLVIFAVFASIAWGAALFMATGTAVGGVIGTHIAKRLPDRLFRIAVVTIGVVAAVSVAFT